MQHHMTVLKAGIKTKACNDSHRARHSKDCCEDCQHLAEFCLCLVQCLVLTGSSADSYKDPDWNNQLRARLAAAVKRQQRILGICYGHQIMARVLGGETGKSFQIHIHM